MNCQNFIKGGFSKWHITRFYTKNFHNLKHNLHIMRNNDKF